MQNNSGLEDSFSDKFEANSQSCPNSGRTSPLAGNDGETSAISLLKCLTQVRLFQCEDISATSLAMEVRECTSGDVVVFRAGADDPIEFAAIALANGATGILTDQLLPCPLPQAIVGDVEQASCELMNAICGRPSQKLMMIGVVGNAGKTTTALMIAGTLRELGIRTAYESDLGSSDGVVQTVDESAPAKGARMIERLADARDAGCGAAVVEFSDVVASVHAGVEFDLLVVTGSTFIPQGNGKATGAAQSFGPDSLAVALDHLATDGVVIVPADHPKLVRRIDDAGYKRLTYGLRREAELSAKVFDNQPGETTLMVSLGDETSVMETKHCGEAMAMNQLATIAVAMLIDTKLFEATAIVSRLAYVPGRMQRIAGIDKAAVVIDSCGDWNRAATTLRTLRQQRCGGKLWCLMALDHDTTTTTGGDETLSIVGRLVERYADRVILTSTDSSKETFLQSAHAVLDGFRQVTVARLVADRKRAIQWAIEHAAPNDTILLLGGIDGDTAYGRRSQVQSLERLVEQCQASPSVKRYSSPATIPMPGIA